MAVSDRCEAAEHERTGVDKLSRQFEAVVSVLWQRALLSSPSTSAAKRPETSAPAACLAVSDRCEAAEHGRTGVEKLSRHCEAEASVLWQQSGFAKLPSASVVNRPRTSASNNAPAVEGADVATRVAAWARHEGRTAPGTMPRTLPLSLSLARSQHVFSLRIQTILCPARAIHSVPFAAARG